MPTDPLWTSAAAAAATSGRATAPWTASGVSIDSRSVRPGDLFVALTDRRDGHDFVAAALNAGAAAALVSRVPDGVDGGAPLLIVPDVLEGLVALGAAARARSAARVIAVTGSVGKTGVKEMLRACLGAQGKVHAAEKSFNNHWGVPLTLARLPRDADYAVIEIGMNHAGEIRPLTRLARPHVALITTIAPAHLAQFACEADIAFAKAEIFEGLEPGGAAILPRDNVHYDRLERRARRCGVTRILRFGAAARTHGRMIAAQATPFGTMITAQISGAKVLFKLGAPGRHLALNAVAALVAAEAAGADLARAALALARWTAPDGRGARWIVTLMPRHASGPPDAAIDGTIELIDESYNANPVSMAAAFEVLAASAPTDGVGRVRRGRRIAILGDMLELGPDEIARHEDLADLPGMAQVDQVHCVGERMKALHAALPAARQGKWRKSSAKMAEDMHRLLDAGDVVMVKGSLGAQMIRVIDAIKRLGDARPAEAPDEAF